MNRKHIILVRIVWCIDAVPSYASKVDDYIMNQNTVAVMIFFIWTNDF